MTEGDFSSPEFDLSQARVAVVGLGLMGGSLALALEGCCRERLGIDSSPETLALAQTLNVAERLSASAADLLPKADLIILATPVSSIIDLLHRLPELHPGRAVVIDLGSTKKAICTAMAALPARFEALGGHPMTGKEHSGLPEADAHLYVGQTFAFTPLAGTTARARSAAGQLCAALGAHALWLDAAAHDRWTAATSHTPYLIANALAAAVPAEAHPLAGPGLRSTTRVAATPAHVMLDILATNHENILPEIARFRLQLDRLEGLLRSGDMDALQAELAHGAAAQQQFAQVEGSKP